MLKKDFNMKLNVVKINSQFKDMDKVNKLALEAFPPEEYLAPDKIMDLTREDGFNFLAYYDKNKFIGFTVVKIYKKMSYLFFLAVDRNFRRQGYGSKIIQKLKELYPDCNQVADFEKVDKKAENYEQRVKRKNFYLKNGYRETGKFLSYLNVDYEVMSEDNDFNFDLFKELLFAIKIKGFNPKFFEISGQ